MPSPRALPHAAQNTISGLLSNGATWVETIILTDENGAQLTGVASDEWRIQLRSDEDSTTTLLVISTASEITITEGVSQTRMDINCPQSKLSTLNGDYVCDVVSKAASDSKLTHRAHGTVTVRNDPVAF